MTEMELYHIHKKNDTDRKYNVGNTIKVKEDFDSVMYQRNQAFNQLVRLQALDGTESVNFYMYLTEFYSRIQDAKVLKGDELRELKDILSIAYSLSFNANFFRREQALESCRKDNYPDLPSRLHSMYLCDADGLEYWIDQISEFGTSEVEIFRVLASDKVFKTNEQLLPNESSNYGDSVRESFKYWNPKFKNVPNYTNEYLAQGEIKLLERVK